jgi:hypothetical protein
MNMSFLSGLESVLGKIGHGIAVGTTVAVSAEPVLSAVPGYGPAIVTAINLVVALESLFPQSGLGAQKAALAVSAITAAHPTVSTASAQAIVNSIVTGLNTAATAAATAATTPAPPPA